ncbi:M14-type cytosolic carboxypeptidase [Fretibacter rubidus]|uniref:M14 family metallopeptidase n=1 Tax=Fretibacter rubidus TaxID=570162 RepID=UPI00352BC8AD
MTAISITSAFDGGNIQVLDASDPTHIRLNIRPDNASDFYQWFYFRVTGGRDTDMTMVIENAKDAAFTGGWKDYQACASYDRETWFRVDTDYVDDQLVIKHAPEVDSVYYAYWAPYSMERHADLIAECGTHPDVSVDVLGLTVQGQTLDRIIVGTGPQTIWITARQHPGETMAEWWAEGFLARLLDDDDPVSRVLRAKATFHIVPNMNPDGSKNGNLRTNEAGANLNREWGVATIQSSPEVYYVTEAMNADRPKMVLDVHGDEALPYNFIAGAEGIPGYTDKQARDLAAFMNAYEMISPDFQTMHGYPLSKPGTGNMTFCTNWTAKAYDCLSMTLEMPFKDNADLPDEDYGWSPERAARLGAASLDAMLAVVDDL